MPRRLKNALIFWTARVTIAALALAPQRLHPRLARALGALAYTVSRNDRRRTYNQIIAALGSTPKRSRLLTRGVFHQLARSAIELIAMHRDARQLPSVEIDDASREALDGALAEHRGVVFVTGHLGNWELMAITLAELGYPIQTIAKPSYDPRFTRLLERFRIRHGVRPIYRTQPGATTAMIRALKNGDVLGLLIDQDTQVPSVFVDFFGRPASTPVGAATLARRAGAPIVVGSIHSDARGVHHILVERFNLSGDDRRGAADDHRSTAALTSELERRIRRHPSQWVWMHQRWRTEPEQEKPS